MNQQRNSHYSSPVQSLCPLAPRDVSVRKLGQGGAQDQTADAHTADDGTLYRKDMRFRENVYKLASHIFQSQMLSFPEWNMEKVDEF